MTTTQAWKRLDRQSEEQHMSIQNHIDRLVAEHKALDAEIARMEHSGQLADDALRQLKKKKLAIRDEVAKLRSAKSGAKKIRKASE